MSTFRGIVAEFPQIRIDYFRQQHGHKAPLACFLSHVHSDHLIGLDSLRSPFVYCSAATREILLRLETYHYRINFARGILESHNVTYDKSMRKLAKPLPLDTPTTIELAPGNQIRVTLIDANHCIGAVMFLIEGDGRAILYTGDVRAESWLVNSLVQNPILLPYTLGSRRLDCLYLDTTFATKSQIYRDFPSKAEGIKELLEKVGTYPKGTIFYFHSWTFGYENAWIALSAFTNSQIHLDDYRAHIYASLSTLDKKSLREAGLDVRSDNRYLQASGLEIREAPALCGFKCGNHIQPGCLTSQPDVCIHSCERGMGCPVIDHDTEAPIIHIIPIVTRFDGTDIAELGAGGGKGDLNQKEELKTGDAVDVAKIMELCSKGIKDAELQAKVLALLQQTLDDGSDTIDLGMSIQKESQESGGDVSLQDLVSILSSHVSKSQSANEQLHKTIRFPYSRHSSYHELCALVDAFKPKDVIPCTVDEEKWDPELGMRHLFGPFCSGDIFRHDVEMMSRYEVRLERESNEMRERESQLETQNSDMDGVHSINFKHCTPEGSASVRRGDGEEESTTSFTPIETSLLHRQATPLAEQTASPGRSLTLTTPISFSKPVIEANTFSISTAAPLPTDTSVLHTLAAPSAVGIAGSERPRKRKITDRQIAYDAALGIRLTWADYGGLVSTRRKEDQEEEEL